LKPSGRLGSDDLAAAARGESDGRVKTRILAIRYMLLGHTAPDAAKVFPVSGTQLRMWVRRYDAQGLEGLRDRPRPGRPKILDPSKVEAFRARIGSGPAETEGLAVYRAEDIRQMLAKEFDSDYSISGTYFSCTVSAFRVWSPGPCIPSPTQPRRPPQKRVTRRPCSRGSCAAPGEARP
jgi:transposase